MEYRGGRTDKAANLQSMMKIESNNGDMKLLRAEDAERKIAAVCDRYAERRGGDCWHARGAGGKWIRVHHTPRRSLFTPCRVPRGPAHPDLLQSVRRTVGVYIDGEQFTIEDEWTKSENCHRVLELPWTGVTTFVSKSDCIDTASAKVEGDRKKIRWADEQYE